MPALKPILAGEQKAVVLVVTVVLHESVATAKTPAAV